MRQAEALRLRGVECQEAVAAERDRIAGTVPVPAALVRGQVAIGVEVAPGNDCPLVAAIAPCHVVEALDTRIDEAASEDRRVGPPFGQVLDAGADLLEFLRWSALENSVEVAQLRVLLHDNVIAAQREVERVVL